MRIGIDVGGTFTDFLLMLDDNRSEIYKTLSTPDDPSIATLRGIEEMAEAHGRSAPDFLKDVDLIVMGRQGQSSIGKVLFGNVTEKITRKAPCAVLVVPLSLKQKKTK